MLLGLTLLYTQLGSSDLLLLWSSSGILGLLLLLFLHVGSVD